MGPSHVSCHLGSWPSQNSWCGKPWHQHPRNSQMVFNFDDLIRIEWNELVLQLWKSKASTMVQAPLLFGRRSLLRWALLRWCTVVNGDGELRRLPQLGKILRRLGFSPGCFQGGRRGESQTEVTSTSPIPASLLQRETVKIRRLRPSLLDSTLQETLGVEAELQGWTERPRVTLSDDGGHRPELGFQSAMRRTSGGKN
jgi:hypothetical protein